MIDLGVLRKSKSPYASCTVIVRKPDGTWQCCIDFRRLNTITKRDVHPLPRTDDILMTLSGAKLFTSVGMYKGYYWQVLPMLDEDMEKTAFNTPLGYTSGCSCPWG